MWEDDLMLAQKIHSDAVIPSKAHDSDAGYDLYSIEDVFLESQDTKMIRTGIILAIPAHHAGMVCSRSGLSAKHGISVLNAPGIIDSGYRGEVQVILHNAGKHSYHVKRGDKIAQLLISPLAVRYDMQLTEVNHLATDDTDRKKSGFGSTGR